MDNDLQVEQPTDTPKVAVQAPAIAPIPALSPVQPSGTDFVGKPNYVAEQEQQESFLKDRAEAEGFGAEFTSLFHATTAAGALYDYIRNAQIPADPNFKPQDHLKELDKFGIPQDDWTDFSSARSAPEFYQMANDYRQENIAKSIAASDGYRGMGVSLLAGMSDPVTAPLMFGKGLYVGPKMAEAANAIGLAGPGIAGKLGAVAVHAGTGAEVMATTQAIQTAARPDGSWSDVPQAAMQGLVFGGVFGTLGRLDVEMPTPGKADLWVHANQVAADMKDSFSAAKIDGSLGATDPRVKPIDTPSYSPIIRDETGAVKPMSEEAMAEHVQSIGAGYQASDYIHSVSNETQSMIKNADEVMRKSDFNNQVYDPSTPTAKNAIRFQEAIAKTPLGTDYDKLMFSGSKIAEATGYLTMDSPSGLARNNLNAASFNRDYVNQMLDGQRAYAGNFENYAKDNNISALRNPIDYNYALRDKFDKELMLEMNSRLHDGTNHPASSPHVIKYADQLDKSTALGMDLLQDKAGNFKNPVTGSEKLKAQSGYFPQKWKGDQITKLIKNMKDKYGIKNPEARLHDTLAGEYARIHGLEPDRAKLFAKALIRGALSRDEGIDTNVIGLMRQDGSIALEKMLIDNGIGRDTAKEIVEHLQASGAERSLPSMLKKRLDVDQRTQIRGTPYTIQDMLHTDVQKVYGQYARRLAGDSALARVGIQNADKQGYKNGIKEELHAIGVPDDKIPHVLIDNLFSHFEGGPIGTGIPQWASTALRLSNLALLNTVGLTKAAEMGNIIGAVGWDAFRSHIGPEFNNMFSGKNSQIINEWNKWGAVGDMRLSNYDSYNYDMMRNNAATASGYMNALDGVLQKGQRLQGFTSGYYAIESFMHKLAVSGMTHKLMKYWVEGELPQGITGKMSEVQMQRRLNDMGLTAANDPKLASRLQDYFKNQGGAAPNGKGGYDIHMGNLDPQDRQAFRIAMNRHVDQVNQRLNNGEGSMWWHKTEGALFMNLKTFAVGSIQKQILRNVRMMDPEATAQMVLGLTTAGSMYAAKQIVTGKTDNLTPEKIAHGAFDLSNFTTAIPMATDPLATILGLDNLKFNHYGQTDASHGGLIDMPPVVDSINRMSHIPGALFGLMDGNYKTGDIYNLMSMPIIGGMAGTSAIFNELKKSAAVNQRARTNAKRKAAKEAASEQQDNQNTGE